MPGIAPQITTKDPAVPLILGVVPAEALIRRRYPEALWNVGGVELRADGVPVEDIVPAVRDFQAEKRRREFDGPVFFTLRLERDGGFWENARAGEREAVWRSLPVGACDFADLEVEEIGRVAPATAASLRDTGARILVSHHAFSPEPPAAWDAVLETMRAFRPDGVKFAVALRDAAEAEALLRLARRLAAEFPVSCALGMGGAGSLTRLISPLLGCPLTYGFLGSDPLAPGQLPAESMRAFFRLAEQAGRPPADATEAEWLAWAADAWARVNRGA